MGKVLDIKGWEERLRELGLFDNIFGGIQIDVNAARRRLPSGEYLDAALCNHNCLETLDGKLTGGKYSCPASIALNKGIMPKTLAPASNLVEGVKRTAVALSLARDYFTDRPFFENYSQKYSIPPDVGEAIKKILRNGKIEVNLFGGNPEMHPEITHIISGLKKAGFRVNLTTTGRRLMIDKGFLEDILSNPPDRIALSADDFESAEQIRELSELSREEIIKIWKSVPTHYGQRQKAYEAAYTASLARENPTFPPLMFNMVLHPGNLSHLDEIFSSLNESFPNIRVNPYPAQSGFQYGQKIFGEEDTKRFARFVDGMITKQLSQIGKNKEVIPRLHYWLGMKSALLSSSSLEEVSDIISGYGFWRCFAQPGAGTYVQIGTSSQPSYQNGKIAGGHLGCFWNTQTITDGQRQVWNMKPEEITDYIKGGIVEISKKSKNPCPGCAMPRLVFNQMSFELGMNPKIWPEYHRLRTQTAGY